MPGTKMSIESELEYWMPSDAETLPVSSSAATWNASA